MKRDDPLYLSKDKYLEDSVAYFEAFVNFDKYYNLTYFSHKLFFYIKITKKP